MLRDVDLREISDGKLYNSNDMVKADCRGCEGCSACCRGMGSSVLLDPLDIHRICKALHKTFEDLLDTAIELHVSDGIILPNLKMSGADEGCFFLDGEGRCSIHAFRPGFCRLFPLGRFYENHSFKYFLQIHECPKPNKTKVKIRKWMDTPDFARYERYISDWHYFLKELQEHVLAPGGENDVKTLSMYVLRSFYQTPFDESRDFYEQFYERLCRPAKP